MNKRWKKNNPESYKAVMNNSAIVTKERAKRNPSLRARINLSARISEVLRAAHCKKNLKTIVLIGCTGKELKIHLEKQFTTGMNWGNYGKKGWEVDHILPCVSFNLAIKEEQLKCFHYTNLQPLWASENQSKGGKLNYIRK